MASSLPSVVDESLLQCPLCYRYVIEPRLLPCLHVFCNSCLNQYVAKHKASIKRRHSDIADNDPNSREEIRDTSVIATTGVESSRPRKKSRPRKERATETKHGTRRSKMAENLPPPDDEPPEAEYRPIDLPPAPLPPTNSNKLNARSQAEVDDDDVDGYEVPHDEGLYEDVGNDDDDDVYANSDCVEPPPGAATQILRDRIGYVTMNNRPSVVDLQPHKKTGRRSKSAPRVRSSASGAPSVPASILQPARRRSRSPGAVRFQHARRQPSSTSNDYVEPGAPNVDVRTAEDVGIYENSEDDEVDTVDSLPSTQPSATSATPFDDRKSRLVSSARELRRWKLVDTVMSAVGQGPPRLTRRSKQFPNAGSESSPTTGGGASGLARSAAGRKSLPASVISGLSRRKKRENVAASVVVIETAPVDRTVAEVTGNSTPVAARKTDAESFQYIYGDPNDSISGSGALVGGITSTYGGLMLDQSIPVYDTFKPSTVPTTAAPGRRQRSPKSKTTKSGSVSSDSYVQLEPPQTNVYGIEVPVVGGAVQKDQRQRISALPFDHVTVSALTDIPCPVCEDPFSVSALQPDGEAWSLGVGCPFVAAMVELTQSQTVGNRPCENCSGSNRQQLDRRSGGEGRSTGRQAAMRCLNCRLDLCNECSEAHSKLRNVADQHRVVDVRDLQSGRHQSELIRSCLPRTPCCGHDGQSAHAGPSDATGQCVTCDRPVCHDCTGRRSAGGDNEKAEHFRHLVIEGEADLVRASNREKDLVSGTLLGDVERRLERLRHDGEQIATYRQDVEAQRLEALKAIAAQKERIISQIEAYHKRLVAMIDEEYQFERDNIRDLSAALDRSITRVDHSSRFVRQVFEHGRPIDITSLATAMKSGLRAACNVPEVTIDARLEVDFRRNRLNDVDSAVSKLFGRISIDRVPCPPLTDVTGNENTTKTSEPVLLMSFAARTAQDEKGCKPTGVAVLIAAADELEGVEAGETLVVVVDDINKKLKVFSASDGSIRLEIRPEGRQRLVDPWAVAVLPPSSRQRAMVPRDPTSTDGATLSPRYVVSDRGARDVKTFTITGELVTSFGGHLSCPWGVATSGSSDADDGLIFVTDTVHRTVFIHDIQGQLLYGVQSKNGPRPYLQCPEYVAVSPFNGDIIVTDFERHTVVFFDKLGRYLTQYSGPDESELDKTGSGTSTADPRQLKVPCGVAVSCVSDGGRVYVADYNNRRIVRLTRNGRYDGSFSANTSTSLVSPQALAFTDSGTLVVADRTNVKLFDIGIRPVLPVRSSVIAKPEVKIKPSKSVDSTLGSAANVRSTEKISEPKPLQKSLSQDVKLEINSCSISTSTESMSADCVAATPTLSRAAAGSRPAIGPKPALPPRPKNIPTLSTSSSSETVNVTEVQPKVVHPHHQQQQSTAEEVVFRVVTASSRRKVSVHQEQQQQSSTSQDSYAAEADVQADGGGETRILSSLVETGV